MNVTVGFPLAIVLLVLAGGAAAVTHVAGLGRARDNLIIAARATAQLAAVSAVIVFVLRSMWLTVAFLLLMLGVATVTASYRISGRRVGRGLWAGVAIVAGVLPTMAIIVASGVLPAQPVAVLPTAGILIGNAMVATALAGRRLREELTSRRGEYEAMLSLGMRRRDGVLELGRPAAALALIPGQDQTRTVGLVTLPGAFVGVLLGGGSAWQAGATQLLVLIGLLLVQSLAVASTVALVAAGLLPVGSTPLPD